MVLTLHPTEDVYVHIDVSVYVYRYYGRGLEATCLCNTRMNSRAQGEGSRATALAALSPETLKPHWGLVWPICGLFGTSQGLSKGALLDPMIPKIPADAAFDMVVVSTFHTR